MQASVGSHCLECAKAARPDIKTRAKFWNARQITLVTFALIAINVLVFVYMTIQSSRALTGSSNLTESLRIGLSRDLLRNAPANIHSIPDGLPGQWYRLISSGFLHYGIFHLGLNMYGLYVLGQNLEPTLGRTRFALVYLASLLGGSAGAVLLQPDGLHGGASGAVFGLFGLITAGYLQRGINPLTTPLGGVLILNVLLSFRGNISFGGHLGGAIAGALCAIVVTAPRHRQWPTWMTYATPVAVAALSVAISVTVAA